MKPLKLSVPGVIRQHMKPLLKRGLSGDTERAVAIRLLCQALREELAKLPQRRGLFG